VARVVLTIEPESLERESIDAAVRLARAYDAELSTVFVKTSDLMNLASLPFGATLIGRSGQVRRMDRAAMDFRLERIAGQARELLSRTAGGTVKWRFRTVTGHPGQVAAGEARAGDLLAVCSRTVRRLGEGDAEDRLACSVLLLGAGVRRDRPVVALFEGDTALLQVALEMARAFSRPLMVHVPAGTDAARLRRNARAWLSRRGLRSSVRAAAVDDPAALARELDALAPGLLIMARTAPAATALRPLLEASPQPPALLLVS
jgi:hypothetical protein